MQLLESRVTLEKGNSACYFSLSLGAFNKNVNKKRWVGRRVGEDSATFWDKEREVPSLSQDKGTKRQAENLACKKVGFFSTIKVQNRVWFCPAGRDSLSKSQPRHMARF